MRYIYKTISGYGYSEALTATTALIRTRPTISHIMSKLEYLSWHSYEDCKCYCNCHGDRCHAVMMAAAATLIGIMVPATSMPTTLSPMPSTSQRWLVFAPQPSAIGLHNRPCEHRLTTWLSIPFKLGSHQPLFHVNLGRLYYRNPKPENPKPQRASPKPLSPKPKPPKPQKPQSLRRCKASPKVPSNGRWRSRCRRGPKWARPERLKRMRERKSGGGGV